MTISDRIKSRRTELGLSVYDLSDRCGLAPTLIYRYEKGEIEKLSTVSVEKLAKGLKCTPAELMGWKTEEPCERIPVYPAFPEDISKLSEDGVITTVKIEKSLTEQGRVIGLRIYGDDMSPYLTDGDIAVIRLTDDVESGDMAAVTYDEFETTLCRVKLSTHGVTLNFFDQKIEPVTFSWQDSETHRFRIIGKCIEIKTG